MFSKPFRFVVSSSFRVSRTLGALAALAVTAAAQTYTHHTGSPYAVGGGIQALMTVDLNGDGKLDLIVTNSTNNGNPTVTALTNTGSGFSAGTPVIVGANPVAVFGAFKSSNNLPGVFTANQNASTITRLNNDGSGNLSVGGTYSLSFQPRGGVVADFNGDGNTELAILGPGIVQTYSWSDASPMNSYTVGNQARAIASGDFNGDGKPDLVVVNFDSSINFLANTGSSFAAASTHPTGGANGLTDIAVADFNRDGKLDVVVAASGNNGVTLFQGDGGGGFTLIGTIGAGSLPRAVRATDMDGDGFPDIVVLNSDDKVTLLLGNGSFSGGGVGSGFSTASGSPYTVGANPAGLVAADFNGDGRPDLAETNANHGNIHVLVNNAPSIKAKPTVLTFYASKRAGAAAPAAIPVAVSSSQSGSTYAAGTGQAYLTLSPASNATGGTSNVTVTASQAALNAGTATGRARFTASGFSSGRTDVTVNVAQTSGGLSAASYSPIAVSGVASIAAADMNHDGIPDLVAFGGSAYKVYNGTGTAFSLDRTQGISGGISPFGVTLGDLNGDGFPDIFWAGNNQLNYALTGWNAFANSTISTSPSNAVSAATGDFNADGYPDAVAVDGGGTLHILRNDGFGNLVRVGTLTGVSSPQGMATGDFNGDGYADFAVAQNNAASLLVYVGNGDYSFQSPATIATGANPVGIAAADVNGDGKIDLLAVNSVASGSLTVQLGNGSGGFSPASGSPFAIGAFPQRLTVADLDGDGFPDVASANNGGNTVAVLKNDGTGGFPTSTSYTVGSSPSWITAADFNGDGRQDVAVLAGTSIYVLLGTAQLPVTVTWANPASIAYPTALSATQLNATFTNGGNPVAGTAVYTPAAGTVPAVGTQTLAVAFTPTSSGFAFAVANATLTVTKGTPGVSVSAVSNPSPYGNASFVVALTTTGGGAAPTGTVTLFYDTTHSLGTQTLAAGSATFSALTIPAGAHTITATYSGDSNFNGVTSSALAHTVSSEPLIPASGSPFAIAGSNDYQSLVSGDFNGDGYMDAAITLTGTSQIAVMAGNGLGGFSMAPGSPFASGGLYPNRMVTADFDGDGKLDLATSNETGTGATFSVLKGNGSGQFTPFPGSPFSSGGNFAHGITATDINNDGKMDLVVVNLASTNAGVFLNNGSGSFSPASGSPLTFSAVGKVAAGDFNGDGFTDLAMTGGSSITIRLGTGTGTFTTGSTVTGGPAMSEIAAADFNLDGKLDLVAANQQTTNQTRVFQGDGAGNFTVSAVLTYGNRLVAADMNSDGKMDIAYLENNVVGVLAGTGTAFNAIAGSPFSLTAPKAIAVADVNGDGLKDILVTSNVSQGLHVLLGYNPNLVITWPAPAAINYGTALSATQLNAVGSQPGTFVYTPAAGTVLNAGTHTLTATLTPTNLTAFSVTSKTVSITVNKVTPSVTWANPTGITYGTALSTTQLNATASVPGTFVYSPAAGQVLSSGAGQTLSVTFTPTDTTNYNSVTVTRTITVDQITPTVTWAIPADITYPATLSATQLNATASVPGTFVYTPALGQVLNAGAGQTLSVTFTPTDSTNYRNVTVTTPITVNQATPTITWANPANITYLTALSATQLNAAASVPGTFAYTPAAGQVLNVGANQTLSVTFTPTDSTNYRNVTVTRAITVDQATPTITWANPATITYPTALSATQLNATASVPGLFTYTPAAGHVLNAGPSRTLSVTFTPTDGTNYRNVTVTRTITVDRATPTITWANPATITYPTALSATQLNATASTPGGFTYLPSAGQVLSIGSGQPLSVTFSPTDTVNYQAAFATRTITVNKPTPSVGLTSSPQLSSLPLGTSVTFTATVLGVNGAAYPTGSVVFYDGATPLSGTLGLDGFGMATFTTAALTVGTHSITASYSGDGIYNSRVSSPITKGVSVPSLTVNPTSLTFWGTAGGAVSTIPVGVTSAPAGANWSATTNQTWLTISPGSNATGGTATLNITANPAALTAGTRSGTVSISAAGYPTATVAVTFNVSNPSVPFGNPVSSPLAVGSSIPLSVAVGDFNGDGKPDVATANIDSNNVTVLLGNGSGGFMAGGGSLFAVGTGPQAVAVGDFNSDGRLDMATANYDSNNVTVLLGNGSGGFTAAPGNPFAVGSGPRSVAVGDFNGDGRLDVATANANSDNVTVLLGNLSGSFTAAPGSPFAVGTAPRSVALGDFNGDGRLDVATANEISSNVTVLLGNGSGGFTAALGSPFAVGSYLVSMAVGDLNGDGKLDVATANPSSDNVTVLLGNGSGGFTAALGSPFAVGSAPLSVALGDFDGDGKPDLATGNVAGTDVTVLLGDGLGGFTVAVGSPFAAGTSPRSVALSDFNGDGRADVVTANPGNNSVSIVLGRAVTSTNLTSSVNPSLYGQSIAFTATVTPASATGTVTFKDGAAILGSGALSGGTATLSTSGLSVGSRSITAVYGGDNNNGGSTSAVTPQVVNKATPTLSLTTSGSPSAYGNSVTFTATATGVSGGSSPSGSVTFYDGATSLGTQTLISGTATRTVSALAIGSRQITAKYSGDANYAGTNNSVDVTSNVVTQTVSGKTLTVSGITAASRNYNGTTAASLNAGSAALVGVVGGDNVTLSGTAAGSFADANVGTGKTVTITGLTLAGTAAGNYTLTAPTASADITQAPASVTPNSATKVFGQADPALSGTLTGFIGGDGITATYSRTAGESVGGSPYTISAVLSPTGALGNYNITYNTAPFTITQVTPAINWATPAPITYGTALSATQLNATEQSSIPGTFSYSPAAGIVPGAGTQTLTVTFTPTDTATYASASSSVSLTVNKATPTITWAAPAAINDGTALSVTQLNATASVPGTFAYSPAAGTVLPIGLNQALAVTFTPTDAANYNTATASNTITVNALLTFNTSPSGLQVVVNGQSYTAPYTAGFAPGTAVTVSAATQTIVANNSQWAFTSWSDAGLPAHSITAGASATYTASFVKQWQFTAAASPAAGGTITPASGWYNDGTVINVSAAANANYSFQSFSGGTLSGATNPQSFTLNAAANVVANFSVLAPNLTIPSQVHTNLSASQVQVTFRVRNTGLGAATNVMITGITVALVAGSGTTTADASVTYPISLGTIPAGATVDVPVLLFNWPSTATRDRFTLNLSADGPYSFVPNITVIR